MIFNWEVSEKREGDKSVSDIASAVELLRTEIDQIKETPVDYLKLSENGNQSLNKVISKNLLDILWDNIYYTSSFAAESITTSSATEDLTAREVDTTGGKKFTPKLDSRYRVNFYIGSGQTNITAYVLSPAISTDTTYAATTGPVATNTFLSYVGIKVVLGTIYLVSSVEGNEITIATEKSITDDSTHTLEINYRAGQSADIYFDNEFIGSIQCKMRIVNDIATYFPYLTSVKSASGSVNLTIENYEFAQVKSKL